MHLQVYGIGDTTTVGGASAVAPPATPAPAPTQVTCPANYYPLSSGQCVAVPYAIPTPAANATQDDIAAAESLASYNAAVAAGTATAAVAGSTIISGIPDVLVYLAAGAALFMLFKGHM